MHRSMVYGLATLCRAVVGCTNLHYPVNHRENWPLGAHPQALPVAGSASLSRFTHRVDGGFADDTGLRAPLETVAVRGALSRAMMLSGMGSPSLRADGEPRPPFRDKAASRQPTSRT